MSTTKIPDRPQHPQLTSPAHLHLTSRCRRIETMKHITNERERNGRGGGENAEIKHTRLEKEKGRNSGFGIFRNLTTVFHTPPLLHRPSPLRSISYLSIHPVHPSIQPRAHSRPGEFHVPIAVLLVICLDRLLLGCEKYVIPASHDCAHPFLASRRVAGRVGVIPRRPCRLEPFRGRPPFFQFPCLPRGLH